jgi:hypothetical protein
LTKAEKPIAGRHWDKERNIIIEKRNRLIAINCRKKNKLVIKADFVLK